MSQRVMSCTVDALPLDLSSRCKLSPLSQEYYSELKRRVERENSVTEGDRDPLKYSLDLSVSGVCALCSSRYQCKRGTCFYQEVSRKGCCPICIKKVQLRWGMVPVHNFENVQVWMAQCHVCLGKSVTQFEMKVPHVCAVCLQKNKRPRI